MQIQASSPFTLIGHQCPEQFSDENLLHDLKVEVLITHSHLHLFGCGHTLWGKVSILGVTDSYPYSQIRKQDFNFVGMTSIKG